MSFRQVSSIGLAMLALFALSGPVAPAAPEHAEEAPGRKPSGKKNRPEGEPEVEFRFIHAAMFRIGSHPVLYPFLKARRLLDPEGADERSAASRNFVRRRLTSSVSAIEDVRDAEPGRMVAVLTPEAIAVPEVAAMIDPKAGLVAIPVGGRLTLVVKISPAVAGQ